MSLLGSKPLDVLPVRIQRFRMRLLRFTYTISHISGNELTVADALSRAPVSNPTYDDTQFNIEVDAYVCQLSAGISPSNREAAGTY